jgi:hypothetical protein
MGNPSYIIVSFFVALSLLALVDSKPALNPVKQSPDDLKLLYQSLQRQLDEENAAAFQNALDAPRRPQ